MRINFAALGKGPKPKSFRLNYSSSFLARTKCVACNKSPDLYYRLQLPTLWQHPVANKIMFDWFKKYIKHINNSWYKRHQPRYFTILKDFNFYWTEKSYNPRLHQYKGVDNSENIVEYLMCPCGKTVWAFNQANGEGRAEIKNRKARYEYPQKFESY